MVRREQIESQESKRDTYKSTIKVSFPVEEHKKSRYHLEKTDRNSVLQERFLFLLLLFFLLR
jgi:hypothetical protein